MSELRKLIASARQQAAATEAAQPADPQEHAARAKKAIALEAARQQRAWADFAEASLDKESGMNSGDLMAAMLRDGAGA